MAKAMRNGTAEPARMASVGMAGVRLSKLPVNVHPAERVASALIGAVLLARGMGRPSAATCGRWSTCAGASSIRRSWRHFGCPTRHESRSDARARSGG